MLEAPNELILGFLGLAVVAALGLIMRTFLRSGQTTAVEAEGETARN